jgi:hypothetical protein
MLVIGFWGIFLEKQSFSAALSVFASKGGTPLYKKYLGVFLQFSISCERKERSISKGWNRINIRFILSRLKVRNSINEKGSYD